MGGTPIEDGFAITGKGGGVFVEGTDNEIVANVIEGIAGVNGGPGVLVTEESAGALIWC